MENPASYSREAAAVRELLEPWSGALPPAPRISFTTPIQGRYHLDLKTALPCSVVDEVRVVDATNKPICIPNVITPQPPRPARHDAVLNLHLLARRALLTSVQVLGIWAVARFATTEAAEANGIPRTLSGTRLPYFAFRRAGTRRDLRRGTFETMSCGWRKPDVVLSPPRLGF